MKKKKKERKAGSRNKAQKSNGHLTSNFMNTCDKSFINNLSPTSAKATIIKN